MKPKEKAKELAEKFEDQNLHFRTDILDPAKYYSLICVEELIDCLPSLNGRPPNYQDINKYTSEYWQDVKNEIILL